MLGLPGISFGSSFSVWRLSLSHRSIEGTDTKKRAATSALGLPSSTAATTRFRKSYEYALMHHTMPDTINTCEERSKRIDPRHKHHNGEPDDRQQDVAETPHRPIFRVVYIIRVVLGPPPPFSVAGPMTMVHAKIEHRIDNPAPRSNGSARSVMALGAVEGCTN